MSLSTKFVSRLLSHEDQQLVAGTHHPAIYQLSRDELRDMRKRLRELRDRERTLLSQKRREMRGKGEPRGGSFPGTADLPGRRKQVFAQALRRVNGEVHRLEKMEAQAVHTAAARRALALRKSGEQFARPQNEPTPGRGTQAKPNKRGKSHIPGSQVGSVTKATARAQAAKDSRTAS